MCGIGTRGRYKGECVYDLKRKTTPNARKTKYNIRMKRNTFFECALENSRYYYINFFNRNIILKLYIKCNITTAHKYGVVCIITTCVCVQCTYNVYI